MKKIISFLFVYIMAISLMTSCAENVGSIAETVTAANGEPETAQHEEKLEVPEDAYYGGYVLTMNIYIILTIFLANL